MPWRITTGEGDTAVQTELEYDASGARLLKRQLETPAGADDPVVTSETLTLANLYERTATYDPLAPKGATNRSAVA